MFTWGPRATEAGTGPVNWDPAIAGAVLALSNGNRTVSRSSGSNSTGDAFVPLTRVLRESEKSYVEIRLDTWNPNGITGSNASPSINVFSQSILALVNALTSVSAIPYLVGGADRLKQIGVQKDGTLHIGTTSSSISGWSWSVGQRLMVAIDVTAKKVWFGTGGTWRNGDPSAGTGGATTADLTAPLMVGFSAWNTTNSPDTCTVYALEEDLIHPIPTGFRAMEYP